jgi:nitrite reductase (NADH) large subunit
MNKETLIVVGNGMVGHRFLEAIQDRNLTEQYEVVTFCEEPRPAYDRVHLSEYFADSDADALSLVKENFFADSGITCHIGDQVVAIDRDRKVVLSKKGLELSYDRLVLATGSYPFVPPIPGNDRPNSFVYRTIEDLEAIQAAGNDAQVGVVVGGGLLGLEAANALKQMGVETHVVEFAPRLMALQIDEWGGLLLKNKIEELGVKVHTSRATTEIIDGENCKHRLCFSDGEFLETDIVLYSAGIRPRDELARECGLEIGQRGGIVIDNHCRTSDDDIFAIGECALWNNQIFGLVAPGYQMAEVVADFLQADDTQFRGADMSTKL